MSDSENKDLGKGFKGLHGLGAKDPKPTSEPPEVPKPTVAPELPAGWQGQDQGVQRNRPQHPQSRTAAPKWRGWLVTLGAISAAVWFFTWVGNNSSTNSLSNSSGAGNSQPARPQALSRPTESKPPIGRNLVLSREQIRYCLAEDIRMDGAKSALNNYSDYDVNRFNAMVVDYNSRCGSFRYRSGALTSARRDIEPYRSQLQSEGRSRFARSPAISSPSAPAPSRPAPDATVQAIQRRLNELGYDAGTPDGLMGRRTRSAIVAFQRDMGLPEDRQPGGDLLALLSSASLGAKRSNSATPNWDYSSEQASAALSRTAPDELPRGPTQPASVSRDVKNFRVCVSGRYPSLCNHALLSPDEKVQVAAAEKRVNLQTCVSGNYPSLCKRSLLTPDEATQVAAAERRANLQACTSGRYPSLCKHSLLTSGEAAQVVTAERRVNFQTCISGRYPSLCKHSLLTSDEAIKVAAAERRVNYEMCISGRYPSLCKHSLLTPDEAARVADAERRAGNR